MKQPLVVEVFTDNGEHSHWKLISVETGIVLWDELEMEENVIVSDGPITFEPIFEETFNVFGLHYSKDDVKTMYSHLNVIWLNSKLNGCVYLDSHERELIAKALKHNSDVSL